MKKGLALEVLLIFTLGISGWYLFGIFEQVKSSNSELKKIKNYNGFIFSDGEGVDIIGNEITSILINNKEESENFVFAFLLRFESLDADIEFWNEVSSYFLKKDNVRFIAYCENYKCVESIKNKPDITHFIVLEYGEVKDMQAVLSADESGAFWLRGKGIGKKIAWRDKVISSLDISRSIEQ